MKLFSQIMLLSISFFGFLQAGLTDKQIVENILLEADVKIGGDRPWDIIVHDDAFYTALLKEGSLGLGESYMEGLWDSKELDNCIFHILRADLEKKIKPSFAMKWAIFKAKFLNRQTKSGSLDVIDLHYQLGNEFFQDMLDSCMTYSCGYWSEAKSLNAAQEAKYDLIARKLGFQKCF